MANPVVHIELSARSHQEAARWYADLFGWSMTEYPDMNYTTFQAGEGGVGGGFNNISEQNPAGTVTIYIHSDDLAADMKRIEENGGRVVMPSMEVPGVGQIGFFQDPTGNTLALLQPAPMQG